MDHIDNKLTYIFQEKHRYKNLSKYSYTSQHRKLIIFINYKKTKLLSINFNNFKRTLQK